MDVRRLFRTLRREWPVAVAVFLLVLGSALLLGSSSSAAYSSSSTLFVQPSAKETTYGSVQAVQFLMPALEARVASEPLDSQVRDLLGPAFASASWKATGAADPGTGILRVTVTSKDRDVPQPAANDYATALRSYATASAIPITISVLDPASATQALASRTLLALGLSGMVLGVSLAVAAAMLASRVRRPRRLADDVRDRYGVPVLGEIPKLGSRLEVGLGRLYEGDDQRTIEAFMRLRTNVEIQLVAQDLHSIAIASRGLGEGKTTVAAHLGWTLASIGHRVLLSDGDLRHERLDAVMRGELRPQNDEDRLVEGLHLQSTSLPKLSFLSAASLRRAVATQVIDHVPHPAEIISNGLPVVAATARKGKALLLVDSPPITGAAECKYIVSVVDGVIVVVDARRPLALEDLEETLRQIRETGASILGVVLNRSRLSRAHRREEERYYLDRSAWAAAGGFSPRHELPRSSQGQTTT